MSIIGNDVTSCSCQELGIEVWLDTFGCTCTARRLTRITDLQVQSEISATGSGQLSFPLQQVGNLGEVWPNQTAVIVLVCGRVVFAGVVKELNLNAGIVQLGLSTWDEWLAFRYLHENMVIGNPLVPVYDAQGNVLQTGLGDDATDAYCQLDGLQIGAAQAIARLVTYAGEANPANTTGTGIDMGDSGPDHRNGLFQRAFCVPSIMAMTTSPIQVPIDFVANWCDGDPISTVIGNIVSASGVEWVTGATQDSDDGCWTYTFTASDHIGSKTSIPVYAPGSSLTITPVEFDAVWTMAGATCFPPNCAGQPRWPAGQKQWGGAYAPAWDPTRAVREQMVDQGDFSTTGTPTQIGAALRTGSAQTLAANPPRDQVEVNLTLGPDRLCQAGVELGGMVRVELGPEAGCYLGDLRITADAYTANPSDGLARQLTLAQVDVSVTSFHNDCGDCEDCT